MQRARLVIGQSAFLALGALGSFAPAQDGVLAAPAEVCRGLDVNAATVQSTLAFPSADGTRVALVLDGVPRTLRLHPFDVRSPNYRLWLDDGRVRREVAPPPSITYRGEVLGVADSRVAASLDHGVLHATIAIDGQLFAVQPLADALPGSPVGLSLVYRDRDLRAPAVRCGVTQRASTPERQGALLRSGLDIAELAIDADDAYYRAQGNSTTAVQNDITTVMNSVDAIYQNDVQISHTIVTIIVHTSAVYTSNDPATLLSQFGAYWNANYGNVHRDVAHLFTGNQPGTGVIGIAYLGVVCAPAGGYGVSWTLWTSSLALRVGLTAHELGHNWGANHCDGQNPCNIMCSYLGGCSGNVSQFAPVSVAAINAFKINATCLTTTTPPPVLSNLSPSSTGTYQPGIITLTGQGLDTVTQVTVNGQQTGFARVNATTLTFVPPSLTAIGPAAIVAINRRGPSNSLPLTITGTHPSVLTVPLVLLPGFTLPFRAYTDAGWNALFFGSTLKTPSALPGVVNLGIGSAFSQLFLLGNSVADPSGVAVINAQIPNGPQLPPIYWQAVTFNANGLVLPLEVSNVSNNF